MDLVHRFKTMTTKRYAAYKGRRMRRPYPAPAGDIMVGAHGVRPYPAIRPDRIGKLKAGPMAPLLLRSMMKLWV